jgi:hypothetical protein
MVEGQIHQVIAGGGVVAGAGDTLLAGFYQFGIDGIVPVTAGSTYIVDVVGVGGFVLLEVSVIFAVITLVSGNAKDVILDPPAVGHDIQTFQYNRIIGIVDIGVTLDSVEVFALYVVHDAHVAEDTGEEQVAGLGRIVFSVIVGNVEVFFGGV